MAKAKPNFTKNPMSPRDLEVLAGAEYFTTFRYKGPFGRDRREFPTLDQARADQGEDPRALVYACMDVRDALIPRDYQL